MLTAEEKKFLEYWQENRVKEKKTWWLLVKGLPAGLYFALPILVVAIFHDWYKNMIYISDSQMILIIIGVLCTAVFFAIFKGRFMWDQNEQFYKELKFKQQKDKAAD